MMEIYGNFASVYDLFMAEVDYEAWADYITEALRRYDCQPKLVLDLGCGTGNMTLPLFRRGLDMIGLDLSPEMLGLAREKAEKEKADILFLNEDMREFELYGTVGAVVSLCDSLNYITEDTELLQVFRLVNNYLDPGGLFIFDLNTPYKFETVLSDHSFCETAEDACYIWENYYDAAERINEYYLNLFMKEDVTDRYRRVTECHYERAYSMEEIRRLLQEAGLVFLDAFDGYSFSEVRKDSERVIIIARENGKQNDGGQKK